MWLKSWGEEDWVGEMSQKWSFLDTDSNVPFLVKLRLQLKSIFYFPVWTEHNEYDYMKEAES